MYKQRIGRVNAKTALLIVLVSESSRQQVLKIGRKFRRNMALSHILAPFSVLLYLDHFFGRNLKASNRAVPGITKK